MCGCSIQFAVQIKSNIFQLFTYFTYHFFHFFHFLGHVVSADGIQPLPDQLAAIHDWPTPHCLRDVRTFYGFASYYGKFVKDFAKIAEPLSRMTKKNTPFMWTDETQQSFEDLKRALLDVSTLAYPTP